MNPHAYHPTQIPGYRVEYFLHPDGTKDAPAARIRYKYFPRLIIIVVDEILHPFILKSKKTGEKMQKLIHYILTLMLLICSVAYIIPAFAV